jgi:pimeloyl-ACP methyl ester carboxylesterase
VNAEMAGGNPLLARALAVALRDGLMPPGRPDEGLRWVVAGHSAGGLFASHLGAALAREAPDRLAGALLFDPVSGAGFADNLRAISQGGSRAVRAIGASASGCNAMNSAGPALAAVYEGARSAGAQAFVGLQLVDRATHLDAEGEDTSALAVWACGQGTPRPENVALLRTLATAWARDMLLGSATPEVQRGGAVVEEALAGGQAVPIE